MMIRQKKIFFFSLIVGLLCGILTAWIPAHKPAREFYQLTVYHYATPEQKQVLDNYLQKALLPALHRAGIKQVGVFSSLGNDTLSDKLCYVLLPVQSLEKLSLLPEELNSDKVYRTAGAEYLDAVYTHPPYTRKEILVLRAFPLAPSLQLPALKAAKKERVYELRSYESATEKILNNKIQMFNEGDEIGLFKRLHFNAAFYAEVLAGSRMPNLMYMTCFENRADRDAHWKEFGNDPYWKKLSSLPQYQHNVSHIDITFLRPEEYSDY